MRFPMIVFKDNKSSYGGLLPDFEGCFPMGQTLDSLLDNVQDAVETWMLAEDSTLFPRPSSLKGVQKLEVAQGRPLLWVDIDTSFLDTIPQHIDMTAMPIAPQHNVLLGVA